MFKIAHDKKITMVQGDTGVIRMKISNHELSQGDEVRFAIVNKANPSILLCQHSDKKIVLEKKVTVFEKDGSARIKIHPYDTEYLQPGKYLYEIQVKTKDGRIDTVVPLASFTLMDGSIQGEFGQTTPSKPEPTPSEIELRFKRLENEIIPDLGNRITNVEKDIDSKAKKRRIYYLSDYGKVNDVTYDNTPAFKQAIKDLQKTGGKLIIDIGTWEFKTPCIIDEWLFGCEIVGMARGITNNASDINAIRGNFGTILNYSGSGCMFTFNGKMNHCRIENLYASLTNQTEFMRFNYTFHKGIIKDISVLGGKGCLDFNTGTYVRIENFGYGSTDENAEYGIRIGKSETRYTTEFFYINNSSIDFGNLSSANCIDIYRMEGGFYIDKTDLCNTNGVGLRVENLLGSSINYFVVRDVNFTRDFICIELYAKTGSIGGVFVDNVRYGLKCSSKDERIVKCYGESGKTVMIHHKNAYVRTYSSLFPTYVAELSRMDWQSVFEINAGNTLADGFNSPIKIGSDITRVYDYRIEYKGTKNITLSDLTPSGVGSNWKDYKIELTSLYPYHYLTPIVMVNFNHAFTNGVIKTEVVENILYVYVRIGKDVPTDNIRMCYQILN